MMPAHCSVDIADVPLSVNKSMMTSLECSKKGLKWAARRKTSRSAGVVILMRSTLLMRKGSMIVLNSIFLRTYGVISEQTMNMILV